MDKKKQARREQWKISDNSIDVMRLVFSSVK